MKKLISLLLAFCLLMSISVVAFADDQKEVSTAIWCDTVPLEPALVAAADAFMADYPNYKVTVECFPGPERPAKLALAKEGNTLPSLFLCAFFSVADEVHQGAILPVTDVIEEHYSDVDASTMDLVTIGDDYYMVPIFTSAQGMLYNADIFKDAGLEEYISDSPNEIAKWTLNDLDTVILPTLKEYYNGSSDYPLAIYCASEQNDTYLINLLKMYGGEVYKDGACVAGEDPNTVKALEKITEWVNNGYTNADATTSTWTDVNADFRNQDCAICGGQYNAYMSHLGAFEDGSAEAFDARVAMVPVEEPDGTNTYSMHSYVYGFILMNVDEDQQQLAKDFLAWLREHPEHNEAISYAIPTTPEVFDAMAEDHPLFEAYADTTQYYFDFTGGAPGWVAARATFYPEMQSCIAGEKSAQDALNDFMNNANEIIQDYVDNSLVLNG